MSHLTSLTPVIEFLRRHEPFEQMAPAHLEYLAKRLKLGFYARNEVIVGPDDGPASRFFVIKQGRVRGESGQTAPDEESAWELVAGECFPIGALLGRRPARLTQRAVEDTFCFELDREDFDYLLQKSVVFHDFCTRRIASLLDKALRGVQANTATRASEDNSLNTPLGALVRRAPVVCAPETPLRAALERMRRDQVGSIVVTDADKRPLGVFTLHDVLARVTLPQRSLEEPIRAAMTEGPLALPPSAPAYEAALLMAQNGFGHICVVENERLVGVLSERDLFSLQRVGLVNLSRAISGAPSIAALARLERDVHRLVEQMIAQGASVEQLTQLITTLNDHLTTRVIALIIQERGEPEFPFAWLAFGSEGRYEQTLRTDQDNGILFPGELDPEAARAALLPFARRVNEALAECGFPLCNGGVMAGNPECCLSLDEWRGRFTRWLDQGTPEHLLKAAIYFDFRVLHGDAATALALRRWLTEEVAKNRRFLRQMAQNLLQNRPPLGLVRDFQLPTHGEHAHTLDLKVQGLTPFVDGARLIALAARITATNTVARLKAAAENQAIPQEDAQAWIEAYQYIQLLRMRTHRAQAEQGLPLDNRVDPDHLNDLDRRILKEAFRQARKLQTALRLDYQL